MDTEKTKVVFRRFKGDRREVIALFPEIPSDSAGRQCSSYMHTGQHGGADLGVIDSTTPATGRDVDALRRELAAIGYNLDERKRVSRAMNEARWAEAERAWLAANAPLPRS